MHQKKRFNISIVIQLAMLFLLLGLLLYSFINTSSFNNGNVKSYVEVKKDITCIGRQPELVIPAPNCGKVARSSKEVLLSDLKWKEFNFHGAHEMAIILGKKNNDESITDAIDHDVKFPKDFPKKAAEVYFYSGSMHDEKRGCYALLDLDKNGVEEIFMTVGVGANGLGGVIVLEKQKNEWHKIFHGSSVLIMMANTTNNHLDIMEWNYDAHIMNQRLSIFNGKEYVIESNQELPWAVAGSDTFRSMFWEINSSCPN